jgi:hypothetical protein
MKLDQAFIAAVHPAISAVWQEIGSDVISCSQEMGEDTSNAEAMESVLDADRLTTNGYEAEDKLIEEAIKEHTYSKVEKFLCKHIKLN